jgi:hypothetical protein
VFLGYFFGPLHAFIVAVEVPTAPVPVLLARHHHLDYFVA